MHTTFFNLAMLALAGVAGASFAWPMKHFRGWRWEHVWIGQALTCNLAFPLLMLAFLWPLFRGFVAEVPAGRFALMVLLGMAWGLGGIGYGLCLTLLGLSFTYSVIFSVTTIFGALLPMWIGLHARPAHPLSFSLGLGLCIAGITVIARAAARRESGELQVSPTPPESWPYLSRRISYKSSLLLAVLAGLFSAAMGLALVINEDLCEPSGSRRGFASAGPADCVGSARLGSSFVALGFGFWCAPAFRQYALLFPIASVVELVSGRRDGGAGLRRTLALRPGFHRQRASRQKCFVGCLYDGFYSCRERHRLADPRVGILLHRDLRPVGGRHCAAFGGNRLAGCVVARASCPLSRERPAPARGAGRMPTPQRAGRPRYEDSTSPYSAILNKAVKTPAFSRSIEGICISA